MTNSLITGGYVAQSNTPPMGGEPQFSTSVTVDGTPLRVALLGVGAAAALYALRKAGFKFNVGVS